MSDTYMIRAEDLIPMGEPGETEDTAHEATTAPGEYALPPNGKVALVTLSTQSTPATLNGLALATAQHGLKKRALINVLLEAYLSTSEEEQADVHAAARRWERERMP